MYRRPRLKEHRYTSPSALHLNKSSLFKCRKFSQLHGPFPVICVGRYAGFEKKQWFNSNIAQKRQFQIFYGYNRKCCFKGFYNKPGSFHYYDRYYYR